jgi:hypothetical protein
VKTTADYAREAQTVLNNPKVYAAVKALSATLSGVKLPGKDELLRLQVEYDQAIAGKNPSTPGEGLLSHNLSLGLSVLTFLVLYRETE